jgi:hypothetical protein
MYKVLSALVVAVLTTMWTCGVAVNASFTAAAVQVSNADAASVRVWQGREAEYEAFLATAPFERLEDIPLGVTHPRRAYFKAGGLVESVAWKVLPPGRAQGFWESYRSEIAAYELDKQLELGMVPVAVEKRWKHEIGAAVLWLPGMRAWKDVQYRPKPAKWDPQMIRMKMFDNLIGNKDRNLGNLLVDQDWNVFLIDHSRAFVTTSDLPAKFTHVDRDLWTRMCRLDEAGLTASIGKWVDRSAIRALLARRIRLSAAIDALVQKNGEAAVFVR